MRYPPSKVLVPAQILLAMCALVGVAVWPPSSGAMLLIPIVGSGADGLAKAAIDGGAALLGPGPLPGSLVVIGDRDRIARQLGFAHGLILAAPPAGCGTEPLGGVAA